MSDFIVHLLSYIGISEPMAWFMLKACWQTIVMTILSGIIGSIIGVPLGVFLYTTRRGQILQCKSVNQILAWVVNIFRSIPFIILIVWMIPLTQLLVGTAIGLQAAIIPLSIGVAPLIARMVENSLLEVPFGLIEAARSMGATNFQIVRKVMLPEALPGLINGLTITLITLIGYSAMAGAVGAGGLGQLAIQYGYNTNNPTIMNSVIVLLIIVVFIIQFFGDRIVKVISHR